MSLISALLIFSILAVVYTYAGFPLVLAFLARLRPRPVVPTTGDSHKKIAIVVVGYNEAHRLDAKIQTCLAQTYPKELTRIIIASDGSSDDTAQVVRKYQNDNVHLMHFEQRRGKAACLNDVLSTIDEEYVVLTDARQRLNDVAIEKLIRTLSSPEVGAVSGELVFEREALSDFGAGIDAYWRYEKFIRHNESESGSVIGVTGALYALKTAYFKPIPHETILDDVLIPMQVALQGMRVTFEKGAIAFDTPSENLAKEQMRKVRTLAGNFQILALCPDLLRIWRNPLWWRYGSHKVLRLLAPLFLTLAFISNALLIGQSSAYQALFAAQLVFYASAVMGMLIPALGRHQIVRLATSFITLNWFVLQGFRHYLTKADAHIWQRGEDTQTLSSSNKKTP